MNKLLATGFIQFIEEATWLSLIVIIPKKNGKLTICINFRKLNVATKKDPYPLPFKYEVLNTITRYEVYSFLDKYLGYHQISITQEDKYKIAFVTD
jgi:putative transposase